jgi:hypothetical protein
MGTGKKEQGRPAESDHGICISNSRARLGDLPFQNIKITKRTHLSFSSNSVNQPLATPTHFFPQKTNPFCTPLSPCKPPEPLAFRLPSPMSALRPPPSALGPWPLDLGLWTISFRVPRSAFRVRCLAFGLWTLALGPCPICSAFRVPSSAFAVWTART